MSHSVPTSPAVSRQTKAYPLTPQRPPHHQQRSLSLYRSPATPLNSPYTPISLRSLNSNGSSTLTTPDNSGCSTRKRLTFWGSPEVVRNGNASKDKSLADVAENWRSRASSVHNKVAYARHDDSGYVLDDSSDISLFEGPNDSGILSDADDEAILGAPFMSNNRKPHSVPTFMTRPRAQSYAPIPSSCVRPESPGNTLSPAPHRPGPRQSFSLMSTPPPNKTIIRQLKSKGSLTDPPQPRRREALGPVTLSSNNAKSTGVSLTLEPNTSLELYDIDENDFEYEHDLQGPEMEDSFSRELQPNPFGYPAFPPLSQQHRSQSFGQTTFADPFHPNSNFGEPHNGTFLDLAASVEHHFHATRQQQPQHLYFNDTQQPIPHFFNPHLPPRFNPVVAQAYPSQNYAPVPSITSLPTTQIPLGQPVPNSAEFDAVPTVPPNDCSVCLASKPTSLAILQPCGHPLCSVCLTSALNIVGEKDMECAVCKRGVADFRLVTTTQRGNASFKTKSSTEFSFRTDASKDVNLEENVMPLLAQGFQHQESNGELDSAFEFGLALGEMRASTPKTEQQIDRSRSIVSTGSGVKDLGENVVLRIDNVPWDITPSQIKKWLQQPVERVHVLLDYKGKTLSHAYVEVANAVTAGAILRGEALSLLGEKEVRGSVLGRGKRARGVTITKSGQGELMRDLFPHWRGGFDGSLPSLSGLDSNAVIYALEGGLITEGEVLGLLQLIREPDSHFLKVPCLPFHSLMSLLNKFPANADSRVVWSAGVRDSLFDTTYTAIQILRDRLIEAEQATVTSLQDEEYTPNLLLDLFHSALRSKAFTSHQIRKVTQLGEAYSLSLPSVTKSEVCHTIPDVSWTSVVTNDAADPQENPPAVGNGSLEDLAKEFGVDAHIVQALAQRLGCLQ